jgi:hypothetical protein
MISVNGFPPKPAGRVGDERAHAAPRHRPAVPLPI